MFFALLSECFGRFFLFSSGLYRSIHPLFSVSFLDYRCFSFGRPYLDPVERFRSFSDFAWRCSQSGHSPTMGLLAAAQCLVSCFLWGYATISGCARHTQPFGDTLEHGFGDNTCRLVPGKFIERGCARCLGCGALGMFSGAEEVVWNPLEKDGLFTSSMD